jgi:hypothetical protein
MEMGKNAKIPLTGLWLILMVVINGYWFIDVYSG